VLIQTKQQNTGWDDHHSPADAGQTGEKPSDETNSEGDPGLGGSGEVNCGRKGVGAEDHPDPADQEDEAKDNGEGFGAHPVHHRSADNRTDDAADTDRDSNAESGFSGSTERRGPCGGDENDGSQGRGVRTVPVNPDPYQQWNHDDATTDTETPA
jgi:hypothetical protein